MWHRPRALVSCPNGRNHRLWKPQLAGLPVWEVKHTRLVNLPPESQRHLNSTRDSSCQSSTPEATVWSDSGMTISRYTSSHRCHYKTNPRNAPESTGLRHNHQGQRLQNILRNRPRGTTVQTCPAQGCLLKEGTSVGGIIVQKWALFSNLQTGSE